LLSAPGTPGQSLDGSSVSIEGEARFLHHSAELCLHVPDLDQVVVTAGGELGSVSGPLKAADFLGVTFQASNDVLLLTNIVVEDGSRARTSGENVTVPGKSTDSGVVHALQDADSLLGLEVIESDLTLVVANSQHIAFLHPRDRGDGVHGGIAGIDELGDLTGKNAPDVDVRSKSDSQKVVLVPVQQVEIEIARGLRGIEDLDSRRGNHSLGASLLGVVGGGVENTEVVLVSFLGCWGLVLASQNLAVGGDLTVEDGLRERGFVAFLLGGVHHFLESRGGALVEPRVLELLLQRRRGASGDETISDVGRHVLFRYKL